MDAKPSKSGAVKRTCEVGTIVCNNTAVRRLEGVLKGDPKFWCCLGCTVWLKRNKIRFREAKEKR